MLRTIQYVGGARANKRHVQCLLVSKNISSIVLLEVLSHSLPGDGVHVGG
jgi:hypothetical protein